VNAEPPVQREAGTAACHTIQDKFGGWFNRLEKADYTAAKIAGVRSVPADPTKVTLSRWEKQGSGGNTGGR